ncbi:MAG: hypothetical protein ACO2ZM_06645 [Francisellaceae bacterium]
MRPEAPSLAEVYYREPQRFDSVVGCEMAAVMLYWFYYGKRDGIDALVKRYYQCHVGAVSAVSFKSWTAKWAQEQGLLDSDNWLKQARGHDLYDLRKETARIAFLIALNKHDLNLITPEAVALLKTDKEKNTRKSSFKFVFHNLNAMENMSFSQRNKWANLLLMPLNTNIVANDGQNAWVSYSSAISRIEKNHMYDAYISGRTSFSDPLMNYEQAINLALLSQLEKVKNSDLPVLEAIDEQADQSLIRIWQYMRSYLTAENTQNVTTESMLQSLLF